MDLLSVEEENAVDMESSVVSDIINQLIEKACISERNVIATDIQSTEDTKSTIDDAINQHLTTSVFEANEIEEKNMFHEGDEAEQSILKENLEKTTTEPGDHVTIDKNGEMVVNIEEPIKLENSQSNVVEVGDQPTKDKTNSYPENVAESSEKKSVADAVIMTESAEIAKSSKCEMQLKKETFDEYHTVILNESDDVKVTEVPVSSEMEIQSVVADEYDTPILQESQANDVKVTESAEIVVNSEMGTQSMVAEEYDTPILQANDVEVVRHAEIIPSSEMETQSMVAEEYDMPILQANDVEVVRHAEIIPSSEMETQSMVAEEYDTSILQANDVEVVRHAEIILSSEMETRSMVAEEYDTPILQANDVEVVRHAEIILSSEMETQSMVAEEYDTPILQANDVKVVRHAEIIPSSEMETQSMVAEEYDTPILQANDVKVTGHAEIIPSSEMETQSMVAEEYDTPILQANDVKVTGHAEIIPSSEMETQSMVAEEYDTPILQANDVEVVRHAEIIPSSEMETQSMADDECVDKKTFNENDMKVLIAEETSKSTENRSETIETDTEAMIIEHCEIVSCSEMMESDEADDGSESECDEIESSSFDHMQMIDRSEAIESDDNGKATMENDSHQGTNYENGQVVPKQSVVDIAKQLNTTVIRDEIGVTVENISRPCGTKPKIPKMFTLRSDAIIASQARAKIEAALKTTTKPAKFEAALNTTTKPLLGVDFYSNEILRSKGYSLRIFNTTREITQLTLISAVNKFPNCEISCTGLPFEMMENHLIPLFEKHGGKIFQMRLFVHKQGIHSTGKVYVTFTTQEEAERAVKTLNRREIQGRIIKVLRYTSNVRVFVKPIPTNATKGEIFNRFKHVTAGLEKVLLFNAPENDGRNRGFCYLEYENYQLACEAKKNLLNKNVFGQPIISDWPQKKLVEKLNDSYTLYISNLRPGLRSAELRKYFDVYGEVSEIDKNGNFASVKFRNSEDAKRAACAVNKKLLGNENVEITFARLWKCDYQGPGSNKGGITERYGGPRATNDTSKKNSFGYNIKKYPKKY